MAEQLFPSWSVSVAQLNSVFGSEKADQKLYNSSIKPMKSTSRPMRFLGFSDHEKGFPRQKKNAFSTILPKLAANGLQHVFEKWVERCK
jgi:hypothetical protein